MWYNPVVVNVIETSVKLHRTDDAIVISFCGGNVEKRKVSAASHYVSFVEYYRPAEPTMSTIEDDIDGSSPALVRFGLHPTRKA